MQTDRICALVVFCFGVIYCILAYFIAPGLNTETLGPRFYPLAVGVVFSFLGIILFFQNRSFQVSWSAWATWSTIFQVLASILVYAYFVTKIGFFLATTLLAMFLSRVFLANKKTAILTGLGISFSLYFVFQFLLGIPLPWGDWIALIIQEP